MVVVGYVRVMWGCGGSLVVIGVIVMYDEMSGGGMLVGGVIAMVVCRVVQWWYGERLYVGVL